MKKKNKKQRRCMYVYVLFYIRSCFSLKCNLLENMNYIHCIAWLGIYYITSINFFSYFLILNQYRKKKKKKKIIKTQRSSTHHISPKIKCNARISAPQKTNTKTKKFVFDIYLFYLFCFFSEFIIYSMYSTLLLPWYIFIVRHTLSSSL